MNTDSDRKKRRLDTSTELEPLTAGQYEPYASGPPSIALEPFNPESAGQSKCAGQYEPHAAGLPSTTLEPVFEPMAPESGQYDTHPFPEVNNSSDNPTKKIYDCRSIIDWKRDFDEICLEGETAVVHAYCPWLDNMPDDTKNLLIQVFSHVHYTQKDTEQAVGIDPGQRIGHTRWETCGQ